MRVIVFDTETTGLPKHRNAVPTYSNLADWPYIVQFSYICYETDSGEIVAMKDYIIRLPDNVTITEDSTRIHGITQEMMLEKGVGIQEVFDDFMDLMSTADLCVAHNMDFDKNMLFVEFYRLSQTTENMFYIDSLVSCRKFYCTMQEGLYVCNIKAYTKMEKKEYIKFPTLLELYIHLFKETPTGLHNALNDVVACARCFNYLKFQRDISGDLKGLLSKITQV
jgi:DNA polymerase III subunit epsilon